MSIYREPVAWSAVAMKRFWDILDRPRWRDGSTVRYRIDRSALVLRLADVVLFPVCFGDLLCVALDPVRCGIAGGCRSPDRG
ncbi:MAG: hypothetical protein F4X07_10455 [Acidimicrobiaceae bacterium]|nr:hypothetical protein [Acidimicrobiaceae bacterium]